MSVTESGSVLGASIGEGVEMDRSGVLEED